MDPRALLDELMGRDRNLPLDQQKNRKLRYDDPEVTLRCEAPPVLSPSWLSLSSSRLRHLSVSLKQRLPSCLPNKLVTQFSALRLALAFSGVPLPPCCLLS